MSNSEYKVPLTNIVDIKEHPNADKLEIAVVYGFEVVIVKNTFNIGDEVVYIPIDSVIPCELEKELFPEGSKIKLNKSRVRQIRIRKFPSQGMLITKEVISKVYKEDMSWKLENDYAEKLGIVKYEQPVRNNHNTGQDNKALRKNQNTNFKKYNGINNFKWNPNLFKEGECVVIQEKIHGSNARAGILPTQANTLWKKILKFFHLLPDWENCYGSNNIQLQDRRDRNKQYYGSDIYGKLFKKIDIFSKIKPGETVYGELYGDGIQKNYNYGCKKGEHKFVLFDVFKNGEWLKPIDVKFFADSRGFDVVPMLYAGPFKKDLAYDLTLGKSVLCSSQPVREGVVIKALDYNTMAGGRKSLKILSEKYLDKEQTDFH